MMHCVLLPLFLQDEAVCSIYLALIQNDQCVEFHLLSQNNTVCRVSPKFFGDEAECRVSLTLYKNEAL